MGQLSVAVFSGEPFRDGASWARLQATKDLDIVLHIEALTPAFGTTLIAADVLGPLECNAHLGCHGAKILS
jgi:hypothetical protein